MAPANLTEQLRARAASGPEQLDAVRRLLDNLQGWALDRLHLGCAAEEFAQRETIDMDAPRRVIVLPKPKAPLDWRAWARERRKQREAADG